MYRAAGQHYTALLYAEQLLRLYPHTFHGYCRGTQDLAKLGRLDEAQDLIQRGLEQFPREFWLLVAASDLHRQRGQRPLPDRDPSGAGEWLHRGGPGSAGAAPLP